MAETCPKCGYKEPDREMSGAEKVFWIIGLLIMFFTYNWPELVIKLIDKF